ncbi:MAG: hypothetical protein HZB71_02210 [Betaproteobacteria bacterium]|nr:hypothetical protein [Betaproteobacteria bacterium]
MLLDTFETQGLLYNSNFKEGAGAGLQAYRGDLVLIEGEIADNLGRRKPPVATLVGAVLLADETHLKFLAGSLDDIAHLTPLVEKYGAACTPGMSALLYVVNIDKPMQVEAGGILFVLLPLSDGLIWNELVDELRLEKGDFKGQSSGGKVVTVYQAYRDYRPKYETVTQEVAGSRANGARRAIHGAV